MAQAYPPISLSRHSHSHHVHTLTSYGPSGDAMEVEIDPDLTEKILSAVRAVAYRANRKPAIS